MAMANSKPFVAIGISLFLSLVVFSNFADAVNPLIQLPVLECPNATKPSLCTPPHRELSNSTKNTTKIKIVASLQDLLGTWNKSTKNVNSSLPGWVSFDPVQTTLDPCLIDSWQGVFCYMEINETAKAEGNYPTWSASVVGLIVSDASIVGTLPRSVFNFINLVSLTLTENPGLSGSLPLLPNNLVGLARPFLKSLDLHGNAFGGNLSNDFFSYYSYIEDLDLSNNNFEGPLPESLGSNVALRTLRVSNNTLTGNISKNDILSWTKIITADFSYNQFVGNIPDFSGSPFLYNLNISHNNFIGVIQLSNILNPQTYESLTILDLSNNMFTGPMPDVGNWTKLQSLNLSSNMFDAGPFPSKGLTSLQGLQTLGLSNTFLNGELNLSLLCDFQDLRIIELDNNSFIGALDIDSYRCSTSLNTILLKHNQIGKVIFNAPSVLDLNITIDLTGNPYCNSKKTDIRRCLCDQLCFDTKGNSGSIIIGFVIGGSLVLVTIIIASILLWKSQKERRYLLLAVHKKFAEYEMKPTLFSYNELEKATRNFHPDMKVGEGAFGAVYKGKLTDGSEVAVKQLFTKAQQNMDDFLNEVVLLSSVKHRNLVKLKGCCLRGDKRLLVYEYVDNYDLADTLFDHKGNQLVTWPARFNICLGVAHGLHYLHAGVDRRIIHRDVKASNVLLDQNLLPKIADFGLAILFPNAESHITIEQVAGTMGYLAPEYATRGQLSDKVDVFSFGVLALEVVSGRKNIAFDTPPNKTYLIEWAWKLKEEGRLMDLVDPIMSIQFDEEAVVQRVITIALACLQITPDRRPTMAQVVGMLQGDIESSESVWRRGDEKINQIYHTLLGLNNTTTTLLTRDEENLTFVPRDEENQALYLGEGSSSRSFRPKAIQLSTIKSR